MRKPYKILYGERLLVLPDVVKMSELIVAPETSRGPQAESGVILDVGHTVDSGEFKVGGRVAFHPGSVESIKGEGERELYVLNPHQVIAFLPGDEDAASG